MEPPAQGAQSPVPQRYRLSVLPYPNSLFLHTPLQQVLHDLPVRWFGAPAVFAVFGGRHPIPPVRVSAEHRRRPPWPARIVLLDEDQPRWIHIKPPADRRGQFVGSRDDTPSEVLHLEVPNDGYCPFRELPNVEPVKTFRPTGFEDLQHHGRQIPQ